MARFRHRPHISAGKEPMEFEGFYFNGTRDGMLGVKSRLQSLSLPGLRCAFSKRMQAEGFMHIHTKFNDLALRSGHWVLCGDDQELCTINPEALNRNFESLD